MIDRRHLLAATAAAGVAASVAARAQTADAPDLSGTSILITGCSSGFGRLMAEHFARGGAKVFATMRGLPRPEADGLRRLAATEDLDLSVLELDVRDPAQVVRAVAQAEDLAGGALDVVVNNAGISYAGPVEMQDMEATRHLFDTNVYGPHRVARAALPAMRARERGFVVNVSSQLGRVIIPDFGQYSPTKFALEAMSEQMAIEVAPFGIDVSIVQPGGYPTRIWANSLALSERLLARTPDGLKAAYAPAVEALRARAESGGGGGDADPMDIPRAVAAIIEAPRGERPLRVPVHPDPKPQEGINAIAAQTQKTMLERMGRPGVARRLYG